MSWFKKYDISFDLTFFNNYNQEDSLNTKKTNTIDY